MMATLLLACSLAAGPQAALAHRMSFVVKVSEPARVADALVARVEQLEGYFASRTETSLVLRVPTRALAELTTEIEKAGVVAARQEQASDLGATLVQKRTLLASRRAILDRYFSVLSGADLSAVVTVEHEINGLVQEIEAIAGELRVLEHRLQLAEVRVDFQFPDRRPPIQRGQSSFAWLNTVDLLGLLGAFAHAPR